MTMASLALDSDISTREAGVRSAVYGIMAGAFAYPGDDLCAALASGEWQEGLAALAANLPYDAAMTEAPVVSAEDLQEAYVTLFDVGNGKPFCPLIEGSHRSGRVKLMEDLVRFYEHFGLRTLSGDHPDHICTELEFMHYLAFKEAAWLSHHESQPGLAAAQRDFLARHLVRWLPRVRARLNSGGDVPTFYRWAATWTDQFCERELSWLRSR